MDCYHGTIATSPEDDSNLDQVTQMLPECFVSVKLETSEESCEKITNPTVSQASGDSPFYTPTQFYTTTGLNASVMQNLQQRSVTSGCGVPSAHCFHHYCGPGMPDFPPWLSHCYAAQMNSEYPQQAAQHLHAQSSCLAQEGTVAQGGERLLKGGNRCDNSSVPSNVSGLTNSDICDSNVFLNCVFNQQRSSSVLLFDSSRSTSTNELPVSATSLNCQAHADIESGQSSNQDDASSSKHMQVETPNNGTGTNNEESVDTSNTNQKIVHSPYPVASSEKSKRTDLATNTVSKYSQTVALVSRHQDAKTDTGDYDTAADSSLHSREDSDTLRQCCKCVAERNMPANEGALNNKDDVKPTGNVCARCDFVSHSGVQYSCSCCSRNCSMAKVQVAGNMDECNVSNQGSDHSVKPESLISHCLNSINKATAPQCTAHCKSMNNCDSVCVKNNRRIHYVDVDRPFTCEICLKSYPSSTALMNHTRYHRGERPYQCEVCNKAFATNSHLVTHRRVHTGERPFQCQLCRRSFADRSAFVKHERTHGPNGTIIKRYKCEECGNAFVDSCGLKKHIRIHTGERPYRCSVCEKTFSTSSTFVAHKRIHSGERPYKCEQCNKMFITKSHLLTHRRTHTGEKPFTCQVCSRAFADGSSFRRHERLHTGENRYTCDVCGKGFPFDTSLAKHKQSHIPGSATYVYMV